MENISVIIILMAIVTALAELTDRIKIPYPILLVLAGIGIGLFPGLPAISLDPDIVFLIFLPPILYSAAWGTSWPDFKAARRPISLLAIGLVLCTTTVVAFAAHHFIPGFNWPEAFVLGAIISPPDAVAATAATKGLKVPKRIITVLEGESLVNDATGLIAYRYAIAATTTGSFVFWLAGANFLYVGIVGLAIGLAVGYVFLWIHKITPNNPTTDTTLTFLAPYTSYLLAEELHASGVLAVVVAGLFLSSKASEIFNHQARLQAASVWDTIIFILNGIIFIFIGLQFPLIIQNIGNHSAWALAFYGFIISITTILVRIIWVFPATYLPRWVSKSIRRKEGRPPVRWTGIVAWSGMRGVVSLAAALALPLTVGISIPFPQRDLIIFLTFCVIFATLVVQGLTLPLLIKWFDIKSDGKDDQNEQEARLRISASVIEHIEENYSLSLSGEVLSQIKSKYEIRMQRIRKDQTEHKMTDQQIEEFLNIQQSLINHERRSLQKLLREGQLTHDALRKLEHELDLEESRLMLERESV